MTELFYAAGEIFCGLFTFYVSLLIIAGKIQWVSRRPFKSEMLSMERIAVFGEKLRIHKKITDLIGRHRDDGNVEAEKALAELFKDGL